MSNFNREERYLVIKISKLNRNLSWPNRSLDSLKREFEDALVDAVVVERDWPEYEKVWQMIEDQVNGEPDGPTNDEIEYLRKQNKELDRLCDATYVAQGADAYNHACEVMEQWQSYRSSIGKELGTTGSLVDGIEWMYSYVHELEEKIEKSYDSVRTKRQ